MPEIYTETYYFLIYYKVLQQMKAEMVSHYQVTVNLNVTSDPTPNSPRL